MSDPLQEATDRAAWAIPHCEETEAMEWVKRHKKSYTHDLLIRATVREGIALLQLQKDRDERA